MLEIENSEEGWFYNWGPPSRVPTVIADTWGRLIIVVACLQLNFCFPPRVDKDKKLQHLAPTRVRRTGVRAETTLGQELIGCYRGSGFSGMDTFSHLRQL